MAVIRTAALSQHSLLAEMIELMTCGLASNRFLILTKPVLSTPYLNIRSGAVAFSSEPGNLMNLHSYKYSGLANSKTVHIGQATKKSGHATAVLALKSTVYAVISDHTVTVPGDELNLRWQSSYSSERPTAVTQQQQ
eukprot:9384-Heterococcus_DN1.PRE.2